MKKQTFSGEMDKVGAVIDIGRPLSLRHGLEPGCESLSVPTSGTLRQINAGRSGKSLLRNG
jgi:hypothetical protein